MILSIIALSLQSFWPWGALATGLYPHDLASVTYKDCLVRAKNSKTLFNKLSALYVAIYIKPTKSSIEAFIDAYQSEKYAGDDFLGADGNGVVERGLEFISDGKTGYAAYALLTLSSDGARAEYTHYYRVQLCLKKPELVLKELSKRYVGSTSKIESELKRDRVFEFDGQMIESVDSQFKSERAVFESLVRGATLSESIAERALALPLRHLLLEQKL